MFGHRTFAPGWNDWRPRRSLAGSNITKEDEGQNESNRRIAVTRLLFKNKGAFSRLASDWSCGTRGYLNRPPT